jgi:hypothetical protein
VAVPRYRRLENTRLLKKMKKAKEGQGSGGLPKGAGLYAAVVMVLTVLVVSWLEPYSIEGRLAGDLKWSTEGDRIPLRAIERMANRRFVAWAAEPVVVEAVKQANSGPVKPLDAIIALDKKWRQADQADAWIKRFLNNPCARRLRELQNAQGGEHGLYPEIFVTDGQGCIVAASQRTSDFWQGDEDKFVKAFADGRGAIFIDEAAYDLSTSTPLIQVSVPVVDPDDGKAIGVMTIGLHIKVLAEQI